jgi:hypothetical protein
MKITKQRIKKALAALKHVDRSTVVTLRCAGCQREMKQSLAFFLRRKFWCSHCEGHFDPRLLEKLCLPPAKLSKRAASAVANPVSVGGTARTSNVWPQESRESLEAERETNADVQVVVVTECDGRKVEHLAVIKPDDTGITVSGRKRRRHG